LVSKNVNTKFESKSSLQHVGSIKERILINIGNKV